MKIPTIELTIYFSENAITGMRAGNELNQYTIKCLTTDSNRYGIKIHYLDEHVDYSLQDVLKGREIEPKPFGYAKGQKHYDNVNSVYIEWDEIENLVTEEI